MYLTILMPCLNEASTIEACIKQAQSFFKTNGISGEVLVSDNGSTDASPDLAEACGARVVRCDKTGYGNALRYGIDKSYGDYIIFGDCDGSYDFSHLMPFIEKFKNGYEFVVGNRFSGGIRPGAMSISHKLGVRFLSIVAAAKFHTPIFDYHCGLHGFKSSSIRAWELHCEGMEFATEIIATAAEKRLAMCEVPVILSKDKRIGTTSHLNTISDGFRNLDYIFCRDLMYREK